MGGILERCSHGLLIAGLGFKHQIAWHGLVQLHSARRERRLAIGDG